LSIQKIPIEVLRASRREENEAVAARLGTTEKTIKEHRAHVKQKMKVSSLADLVRIARRLQIAPSQKV
jgi:FixJ family two-component response regulator